MTSYPLSHHHGTTTAPDDTAGMAPHASTTNPKENDHNRSKWDGREK